MYESNNLSDLNFYKLNQTLSLNTNRIGDLPNLMLLTRSRGWLSPIMYEHHDLPANYKTTENVTLELERVSLAAVNVTTIPQI